MLEEKHKDFFDQVLYRGKKGDDRDEFRYSLIKDFWKLYAPRMEKITALDGKAEGEILDVIKQFNEKFPDFDTSRDYYITIAFSFRGKVTEVNGEDVFAIGLEDFGDDVLQFKITVAHELFHLYHFQFFSTKGALYRKLWAEGMATYASALIVPGYRDSKYLNFPVEKMNTCHDLLPEMASELRKNMGEVNRRLERIYLGAEKNDTKIPPEAGYYVGSANRRKAGKGHPFREARENGGQGRLRAYRRAAEAARIHRCERGMITVPTSARRFFRRR